MGLNFRQSLISELERRQEELDVTLALLLRLKTGGLEPAKQPPTHKPVSRTTHLAGRSTSKSGSAVYDQIQELRLNGLTLRAIGEQVNLSHAAVWKALRKLDRRQSDLDAGSPPS
jgi:biotin operon repressor